MSLQTPLIGRQHNVCATAPLIIIGLDGASFNVLDPLIAQGQLPHLAQLAQSGLRTTLESTRPAATLPAWTSFLTAASPSVHGITDLWMRMPNAKYLMPAQGHLRCVPTFLQMLQAQGLRVACLGVPGTYPPEPSGGVCISGFDAPGAKGATPKSVWPPEFYASLKRMGGWSYATFNEHRQAPDRQARAVQGLLSDIDRKQHVILQTYKSAAWDVFMVHLQASDTAGHHLWHTWDKQSPRHTPIDDDALSDALPSIYRRLDKLIGALLACVPKDARILVVSDHGMGGADTVAIHPNRLLHTLGLLQFEPEGRRRLKARISKTAQSALSYLPHGSLGHILAVTPKALLGPMVQGARGAGFDWANTQAFSYELDYAPAIWLMQDGPHPPSDAMQDAICSAFLALRHPRSQQRLVAHVRRRAQLDTGPKQDRFPHLLLELAWPNGYRPSCLVSEGPGDVVTQLPPSRWRAPKGAGMPGVHQRDGILLASGPNLPATTMPSLGIAQGGALVYALMGQPLPAFADGALPDVWAQFLAAQNIGCAGGTSALGRHTQRGIDPVYAPKDAASITARLIALGYMD